MISPQDIERIDREFMRNQERDRMNERTGQIWPIFLSLSTVFGFIGLQNGEGAYLVGLFPILVSCLAEHIHDSERTLAKKIRKFLFKQEQDAGCLGGGECFFQSLEVTSGGGSKKALRRAFVVTSLLASYLFITHLRQDHVSLPLVLLASCLEIGATAQTFYWLTYWKPLVRWWKSRLARRRSHS